MAGHTLTVGEMILAKRLYEAMLFKRAAEHDLRQSKGMIAAITQDINELDPDRRRKVWDVAAEMN